MFKLFRRRQAPAPVAKVAHSRVAPSGAKAAQAADEPPPMLEVKEDDDESAWDLWEQSQFQLDSQMGGLSPSDSVRVKDRPSQAGELDPFSRIGKNDG